MELVQFDKPVDRVRAFIVDYAAQLYGIPAHQANGLAPLVEIAFNPASAPSDRIRASSELLKYSEVPTRAVEYQGGNVGPDLEITVLGTCEIKEPTLGITDLDTKQLATPTASDPVVELPDERREEGS